MPTPGQQRKAKRDADTAAAAEPHKRAARKRAATKAKAKAAE
jgi:hypothetical protein